MIFIFTFFGFRLIKCSQLGQYCTKNDFVIKMTLFHPSDQKSSRFPMSIIYKCLM